MSRSPMSPFVALSLALVAAAVGCRPRQAQDDSGGSGGRVRPPPTPRGEASNPRILVAGRRPAIRDATFVKPTKEGVTVTARAMVSRVTPRDGARMAIRVAVPSTSSSHFLTWPLSGARVVVVRPDRSVRKLELAPLPGGTGSANLLRSVELVIDGRGVSIGELVPWRAPEPDVFAAPGRYLVRVEGRAESRANMAVTTTEFTTADVPFEVAEEGAELRPLAELEATMVAAVGRERGQPVLPDQRRVVVDDTSNGRWFRLWLERPEESSLTLVDTLLTPAGVVVAMQEFHHSTCVARGTVVATPDGGTPIEALVPGDRVWGWDVEGGNRVETIVESIAESARERLLDLGPVRLTADHPVLADGRWVPAADVTAGVQLVTLDGPSLAVAPAVIHGHAAVFDLTVAWPHTFFAGTVLVHNKQRTRELAPGDPWRGTFQRATDE